MGLARVFLFYRASLLSLSPSPSPAPAMAKNKGKGNKTHNTTPKPSKKTKNNPKEDILASDSDLEPELDEEAYDLDEVQSQSDDDASSDGEPITDDFLGESDEEGEECSIYFTSLLNLILISLIYTGPTKNYNEVAVVKF